MIADSFYFYEIFVFSFGSHGFSQKIPLIMDSIVLTDASVPICMAHLNLGAANGEVPNSACFLDFATLQV